MSNYQHDVLYIKWELKAAQSSHVSIMKMLRSWQPSILSA